MYEPKFVDVAGIRTRYVELGAGEPLVLVHGGQLGSLYCLDAWGLNLEGLARHHHVYAFDKLGQGYTDGPRTEAEYTMDAIVQHAHGFLQALGVERAHLVGHSRGAYVATRLEMEHPGLAKSLILVDSTSIVAGGIPTPFYERIAESSPPWGTRAAVLLEPTANAYSARHITEDFVDGLMKIAALPKSREVAEKFRAVRHTQYYPLFARQGEELVAWIKAGGVQVPVLIVWGFNDPSAPLDSFGMNTLHLFAAHVPRTQMHIFNQAGHYSFREHPDELVAVVSAFIAAS
ncbi:MAG: alpha/beta hydrolase [Chloroflexi bacterium]|nr:alpha/beta hydrolase [Chloroflexota bacterium]